MDREKFNPLEKGVGNLYPLPHTQTQEALSPAASRGLPKTLAWDPCLGCEGLWALPHRAGLEGLGQVIGLVQVLGEDSCSQPILGIVGSPSDFLHGLELQNLHHWPKDLG